MSSELIDFLRARLDEDEATARAAAEQGDAPWWHVMDDGLGNKIAPGGDVPPGIDVAIIRTTRSEFTDHVTHHDPARVLREVEAKRQIVDAYLPPGGDPHPGLPCTDDIEGDPDGEVYAEMLFPDACVRHLKASERLLHHDYVLRLLAAVYAAHPDYRQEWTP